MTHNFTFKKVSRMIYYTVSQKLTSGHFLEKICYIKICTTRYPLLLKENCLTQKFSSHRGGRRGDTLLNIRLNKLPAQL